MTVFPGGIAGASLKPRLARRAEPSPVVVVFPGGIAGASLKPRHVAGEIDGLGRFSPAESPGPH